MTPLVLLLDLDDTLLQNATDTFYPAYLKALTTHMARYSQPVHFTQALMAGTQRMMENRRIDRTLKEVFDEYFYPAINHSPEKLQSEIDDFYRQVFPTLQALTQPQDGAQELMAHATQENWQVVIATNPLFPRLAIEHRLAWAGLPCDENNFALITSYEHFHFTKPSAEYYAEILARLGWPQSPLLVVGNDPDLDLHPAKKMGLPTFWVTNSPDGQVGNGRGPLVSLLPWLAATPKDALAPVLDTPEAALATLRATPAVLDTWCRNLPTEVWKQPLAPDAWSLTENLCHLCDSDAEIHLPRLEKTLKKTNPFIPAVNADRWATERCYHLKNGPDVLSKFFAVRQQLLTFLENLPTDAWQRPMRHGIFGPSTLAELVYFMAEHDRTHIRTIYAGLQARIPTA